MAKVVISLCCDFDISFVAHYEAVRASDLRLEIAGSYSSHFAVEYDLAHISLCHKAVYFVLALVGEEVNRPTI